MRNKTHKRKGREEKQKKDKNGSGGMEERKKKWEEIKSGCA